MGCTHSTEVAVLVPARIPTNPAGFRFFTQDNVWYCVSHLRGQLIEVGDGDYLRRSSTDTKLEGHYAVPGALTEAEVDPADVTTEDTGQHPKVGSTGGTGNSLSLRERYGEREAVPGPGPSRGTRNSSVDSSVVPCRSVADPYFFDDGSGSGRFVVEHVEVEILEVFQALSATRGGKERTRAQRRTARSSSDVSEAGAPPAGFKYGGSVSDASTAFNKSSLANVPPQARAQALILAHRHQLQQANLNLRRKLDKKFVTSLIGEPLSALFYDALVTSYMEADKGATGNLSVEDWCAWLASPHPEWSDQPTPNFNALADNIVFRCMLQMAPVQSAAGLSPEEFIVFMHNFCTATRTELREFLFDCLCLLVPWETAPEGLAPIMQSEIRSRFHEQLKAMAHESNMALLRLLTAMSQQTRTSGSSHSIQETDLSTVRRQFLMGLDANPVIMTDIDTAQSFMQGLLLGPHIWQGRRDMLKHDFKRIPHPFPELDPAQKHVTPKAAVATRLSTIRKEEMSQPATTMALAPRLLEQDLIEARVHGVAPVIERRTCARPSFHRSSSVDNGGAPVDGLQRSPRSLIGTRSTRVFDRSMSLDAYGGSGGGTGAGAGARAGSGGGAGLGLGLGGGGGAPVAPANGAAGAYSISERRLYYRSQSAVSRPSFLRHESLTEAD